MNLKAVTPLGAALIVTFGCSLALLLENLYLFGYHLDLESAAFLGNYLADRSLPELVFDPARNDWKLYQARELSYFFDCLDARFIGWSIRHGWCQFYTLSGFLMLTAAVFVQQYGIRTLYPKLPGWIATLFSFAYVLTPCVAGNGFFRSSKYGCALTFTIAVFLTFALFRGRFRRWKWKVAGIAAALLGATLFDRQGAFFAAAYASAAGFFLLLTLWNRFPPLSADARRILCSVTAAALAVVLAGTFYNLVIGPKLIYACNGYVPDFSYQNMSGLPPEVLPFGGRFLFRNIGYSLAGMTGFASTLAGSAAAAALLALLFFGGLKLRNRTILLAAAAFAAALAGCWVAAAGMVGRHPAVLVPAVMFSLYFLPGWSLLLPFFAPAAETVRKLGWKVNPVGFMLTVTAAVHLGGYLLLYRVNPVIEHQRAYQEAMPAVRRALADPGYDWRRDRLPVRLQFLIELFRSQPK